MQICITPHDAVDPRYEYKDGCHLLSTITESMKQEAAAIATSNGFEVIGRGDSFVSLGMDDPDPEKDVALAQVILSSVFEKQLGEIAGVVEACADGGHRHWLASDGRASCRTALGAV